MTTLTAADRQEISETLALVGHIADGGELDRLGEVFTPDAVYDLTDAGFGVVEGLAGIRQGAERMGDHGPLAHHVTNVVISGADGDTATARSKGLLLMRDGTVGSIVVDNELRRQDGAWRISRHVVTNQR